MSTTTRKANTRYQDAAFWLQMARIAAEGPKPGDWTWIWLTQNDRRSRQAEVVTPIDLPDLSDPEKVIACCFLAAMADAGDLD